MDATRRRTNREEWRKRIERWKDSGLSAEQFAAELGINAGTLRHRKYMLAREARRGATCSRAAPAFGETSLPVIEVRAAASERAQHFELELSGRRWLRIPTSFDPAALERLLAVLEREP